MTSIALAVPLILVSIIGLLLNIYILVVVLLTRQVFSANNLLLFHLGVVDALLGVLFLSFSGPGLTKENWFSIGPPCAFHGFLFTLLHPLLLWTVCGLNCDRYYAIASPLHYGHLVSSKKILIGLGTGWAVSLILCVPPLFTIAPYKYIPCLGACAPDFSGKGALWYSAIYTAITLLLPATLIICCNMKILMIARYHRHRIASAIYEVTLSAQVTITHQRNPFFVPTVTAPSAGGPKFKGKSALYSVLQLLGSFIILYLPYYMLIMWQAAVSLFPLDNIIHPHFLSAVFTLLTCSPTINGFLYGVKNKTIRKSFQNYWRKMLTKNEVNQEIQARTPSTCGSRRQSLTPLGFFSKPMLQRRLSEALLEAQKASGSPQRSKIKRIASELTWKKDSSGSLNLSPTHQRKLIKTAASCNTLQVPKMEDEELAVVVVDENKSINNKSINRLQKLFGCEETSTPKKSPKILITRAFSEESDKNHSKPSTPSKDIHKTHSTTTLLERKWKAYKHDLQEEITYPTMKPLLYDSSETSEESGIQMKSIQIDEPLKPDNRFLISWPNEKGAKNNFQNNQEVIL